jgi:hypothetical protein
MGHLNSVSPNDSNCFITIKMGLLFYLKNLFKQFLWWMQDPFLKIQNNQKFLIKNIKT